MDAVRRPEHGERLDIPQERGAHSAGAEEDAAADEGVDVARRVKRVWLRVSLPQASQVHAVRGAKVFTED